MTSIYVLFMRFSLVLSVFLLLLGGCGQSTSTDINPDASSNTPDADPPIESTQESPPSIDALSEESSSEIADTLITSTGIGQAQLGMTLGDLRLALRDNAELVEQSPFMVGFDAIAIVQDEIVQYYVLYLAGEPLTDDDIIQGLLTDNPAYKTAEGVGPGTLIQESEVVYGQATLSYHTDNESREYVRFEHQPASNLSFGTGVGGDAGVYTNPIGGFNETQDYQEGATIQSVLLVCLTEGCVAPEGEIP
jgi:hypothetical protein